MPTASSSRDSPLTEQGSNYPRLKYPFPIQHTLLAGIFHPSRARLASVLELGKVAAAISVKQRHIQRFLSCTATLLLFNEISRQHLPIKDSWSLPTQVLIFSLPVMEKMGDPKTRLAGFLDGAGLKELHGDQITI